VYELTERGQGLEPVVLALGRWGSVAPFPAGDAGIGVDAFVIALKTLFERGRDDAPARYELRLGDRVFRVAVAGGRLEVAQAAAEDPDAVIEGEPGTLAAILWHGRDLGEAERSGAVRVSGSRRAVRRFLRLFPLPA
jgi:hypothetical protein